MRSLSASAQGDSQAQTIAIIAGKRRYLAGTARIVANLNTIVL
jgi:hypothetical protein